MRKEQMDLFKINYNHFSKSIKPLAERVRPKTIKDFIGQNKLLNDNSLFKKMILNENIFSMILFGPPGSGKTTLAKIISENEKYFFVITSPISSGVNDIKKIVQVAKENLSMYNKRTIIFVDEIHRFNKSQQDYLLDFVEKGDIIFIGATTENPLYSINNSLLSRMIIFELEKLNTYEIYKILQNAIENDDIIKKLGLLYTEEGLKYIANASDGDVRTALNYLEIFVINMENKELNIKNVEQLLSEITIKYHYNSDKHYDFISAFIKSLRIGNVDASLYYLGCMLTIGEDINYICRRMIVFASEDIGNANPNAIVIANSCAEAVSKIGQPESRIILSQCAIYLAQSEKSNSSYLAINSVLEYIKKNGIEEIPEFLKISPKLNNNIEQYKYPHDYENMCTNQEYLSDKIKDIKFYYPKDVGYESNYKNKKKEKS